MFETLNNELSKLPSKDVDKYLDAIHAGFSRAGYVHCSVKAMMHNRRTGSYKGTVQCEICEKVFMPSEVDLEKPCPNCNDGKRATLKE